MQSLNIFSCWHGEDHGIDINFRDISRTFECVGTNDSQVTCGVGLSQNLEDLHVELVKCLGPQVVELLQILVCLLVVIVGGEEADAFLDFAEDIHDLGGVFHRLVMVEYSGALFKVFVVLLVLLDFADHAGEDELPV